MVQSMHHPESPRAVFEAGRRTLILSLGGNTEFREPGFELMEKASRLDKTGINPDLSMIVTAEFLHVPQKDSWYESAVHKLSNYPLSPSDVRSLRVLLKCQTNSKCKLPKEKYRKLFMLAASRNEPQGLTMLAFYEANVMGDYESAKAAFEKAIGKGKRHPSYNLNYASLLVAGGEYKAAELQLNLAEQKDTFNRYRGRIKKLRKQVAKGK
jgi:predicted Zn-dependent protease